jgi:hypothetical protein
MDGCSADGDGAVVAVAVAVDEDDGPVETVTVGASLGQMTSAQMHSPDDIEGSHDMTPFAISQQQQDSEAAASCAAAATNVMLLPTTRAARQVLKIPFFMLARRGLLKK